MNFAEIINNWLNGNRKDVIEELQAMSRQSLFMFCIVCSYDDEEKEVLHEIERYITLSDIKV